MAHTKRKRRTKHRGNAAGMVESRGRTSKPSAETRKRSAATSRGPRGAAPLKPPTLQSAAIKAAFGCVILFVFFRFLSKSNTTGQALAFCAVAFVMYTPIMYWTDKFIYNRKLRQTKR
jgi:hypothetical protein